MHVHDHLGQYDADSVVIRPMEPSEISCLRIALLSSIHVSEGDSDPPEAILGESAFAATLEEWGRDGDLAMVAVDRLLDGGVIGAAWVRKYTRDRPTYGYFSDDIPVLSMSVSPGYRGGGVGTRLLAALVAAVRSRGYRGISLSVDSRNRALRLYRRFGFETVDAPRLIDNDENPVMLVHL